jgi:hypothetical protein
VLITVVDGPGEGVLDRVRPGWRARQVRARGWGRGA